MEAPIKIKFGGKKYMWKQICDAYEARIPVVGTIADVDKSSLFVDIGTDIRGIAYSSKIRHRRNGILRKDIDRSLIGKKMAFLIEKPSLTAIRLTRKPIIEEEMREAFDSLRENDPVEGEVVSLQSYGAFIKFGMLTGLLHRDCNPDRISPKRMFSIGDRISAIVKTIDRAKKQVILDNRPGGLYVS